MKKVLKSKSLIPTLIVIVICAITVFGGDLTVKEGSIGGLTREIFIPADYVANKGDFRVRSISGTGSFRFNFRVPSDFSSLESLKAVGIVQSGAAGSGKDIDLTSDYGKPGEAYTNHSESDTSSTYNLTGYGEKFYELDISGVFSSLGAEDNCGVLVDHKGIGGYIYYTGVYLKYKN